MGGPSSKSYVREVVESVVILNNRLQFGKEVVMGDGYLTTTTEVDLVLSPIITRNQAGHYGT
jgi:hypothetical protein